jgi:nitrate/TMAO reductase-like tetraheme cytochrome c subunit
MNQKPEKMKRMQKLTMAITGIFMASLTIMSCTKEGPAGIPGKDGEDGINGQDGTAGCIECHNNSQALFAKTIQWENSTHAMGGNFERNTGDCATCHTSQGFLGYHAGTYDPSASGAAINNPNPPNCYTCHNVHSTYTPADWELTVTGAVTLNNTTQTPDYGAGSLCASCHQGRPVEPFPTVGGGDITISGTRYGVHHGPQANVIKGTGLFEPGTGYVTHPHANIENTCVTCHMAEAYGTQSGGHTMFMGYDYHGSAVLNTAGCVGCHADIEGMLANTEELQAEVSAMLAELKTMLDEIGATNEGSDNSVAGTYPPEVAGAVLNYKALTEDRSLGVHNPSYVKKVLQNTMEALQQ